MLIDKHLLRPHTPSDTGRKDMGLERLVRHSNGGVLV